NAAPPLSASALGATSLVQPAPMNSKQAPASGTNLQMLIHHPQIIPPAISESPAQSIAIASNLVRPQTDPQPLTTSPPTTLALAEMPSLPTPELSEEISRAVPSALSLVAGHHLDRSFHTLDRLLPSLRRSTDRSRVQSLACHI